MKTIFQFISCLLFLALLFSLGCGNKVETPKLSPDEQAKADKLLAVHGKNVIVYYFNEEGEARLENYLDVDKDMVENIIRHLKYFVSKGANVNAKDNYDYTPLHVAAYYGKIDIVKFLVSKGSDVHARNNEGGTPFHTAVTNYFRDQEDRLEIVKYLVSEGVDTTAKDDDGETPLDYAKRKKDCEKITEYLSSMK